MDDDPNLTSISAQLAGTDLSNLYSSIDRYNVHGLNLTVPEDAQAVIKPWQDREDTSECAESGVDDQMIIHVPFTHNVRVRSILLKLGRGEVAPRQLRLYVNHNNIVDFSEAEDITPHLHINLSEGEISVSEYPLRSAVFANVHALSIFFSDSSGRDSVRVYYIGFRGDNRTQRKEGVQKLEIPAANAPDVPLVDRLAEKSGGQQTTAR